MKPVRPLPAAAEPLAEIEAMILRLTDLRQREPGKERRPDYGAAIDRLHALSAAICPVTIPLCQRHAPRRTTW